MTTKPVIGLFLLIALCLGTPQAAAAAEMAFRLVPLGTTNFCGRSCVEIIAAEGEITDQTPEQFLAFASSNVGASQARNVLFLDSPGGNVVGALRFGRMLRKLGTAVVVARVIPGDGVQAGGIAAARCMSACVYALMGGKKRVVPPESQVG
ncbi:MAG: hypothetical protein JOY94_18185, partial [Methylobacteriaceae bacterium]|nr:hypothetical protein [Methylobacteriaceae bacterium]